MFYLIKINKKQNLLQKTSDCKNTIITQMKIYNIEEHLNCYCYDKVKGGKPIVEVLKFASGETSEFTLFVNEIAFIVEGRVEFILRDNPGGELREGQIVFLLAKDYLKLKAVTDSTIIFFRLNDGTHLCRTFNMERLCSDIDMVEKPESIFALETNEYLQHFAEGLLNNYNTGLKCRIYLQAEISVLLIMISAYYPEEDLLRFFYSILNPDMALSEYVRMNWRNKSVNKLAAGFNLSTQLFTKRFQKVFGMTPHKWMQQEKARLIYMDISMSDKMFKEIAYEYGFGVPAHFCRFCKMSFGLTPGEIRNNKKRI